MTEAQDKTASAGSDLENTVMTVRGLWKVYGENPEKVMQPEHLAKSKSEILEELGNVVALQDVSFDVPSGKTLVVMGLSGSGKSTLVRCLIRLIEPVAGEIEVEGEDILQYTEKELTQFHRSKTAMVFQHFGLMPHRNVASNIRWGLEVRDLPDDEVDARTAEAIEQVGLVGWERAYPRELSGGMQQRVTIAMAISLGPKVIIADEPTSALDVVVQRHVIDTFERIQTASGTSVILVGHDMGLMAQFNDRIAVMYAGRIVEIAPVADIFARPEHPYTKLLVSSLPHTRNKEVMKGIPGLPPSLVEPISGCPFNPRCPFVMEKCLSIRPELTEGEQDSKVACHLPAGALA